MLRFNPGTVPESKYHEKAQEHIISLHFSVLLSVQKSVRVSWELLGLDIYIRIWGYSGLYANHQSYKTLMLS